MEKNKESCSPYFEAEDSVITKNQKKAILISNMESTGIPLTDKELVEEASETP